ncbi:MAG: DUF2851 family protein [Rhodothermales bacterium]
MPLSSVSTHTVVEIVGEPDTNPSSIPESVIHEIWRLQHFRKEDLQTVDGRRVVILDPGRLNENQGPDFLDARIVVGFTTWAGSIEIHRTSSDWNRHRHHTDPHYQPVILHVTLLADRCTGFLKRSDGTVIPEIVLYPRLKESLRKIQWQFRKGGSIFFACHEHWMNVSETVIAPFLDRLAADRLKRKADRLGERFLAVPDLDQVLYEEIFRCLGYSQNAEAMVLLARRIPLRLLQSISDPRDAAAVLLGTAGILNAEANGDVGFDLAGELRERFEDARTSLPFPPLPKTVWRSGRLRPANNPRRRILQGAILFGQAGPMGQHPADRVLPLLASANPGKTLQGLLKIPPDLEAYVAPSRPAGGLRLGRDQQITTAANAILPMLVLRAEQLELTDDLGRAAAVSRKLPVVMDSIVRRYSTDRGRPVSTSIAQGLHELSRSWCGQGRCRECPIWQQIAQPDAIRSLTQSRETGGNSNSAVRPNDL